MAEKPSSRSEIDLIRLQKKEILARINSRTMSSVCVNCLRNLRRIDLRRSATWTNSAQSTRSAAAVALVEEESSKSTISSALTTENQNVLVKTAKNVITPSALVKETLDNLYGSNGSAGIAKVNCMIFSRVFNGF